MVYQRAVFLLALASTVSFGSSAWSSSAKPAPNKAALAEALSLYSAGKVAESEAILDELVLAEPANSVAWFNLGNARFRRGRLPEAMNAYGVVIDLDSPLAVPARLYLARGHDRLGRHNSAVAILEPLRDRPLPLNLERLVRVQYAIALFRAEHFKESVDALKRAYQLFPPESASAKELRALTGLALLRLERPEEARVELVHGDSVTLGDDVRFLIRRIDATDARSTAPWTLDLDLASGYNSNVFSNSESTVPLAAPMAQLYAGATYLVPFKFTMPRLRLSYSVNWEEVVGLPAGRTLAQNFTLQLAWEQGPWSVQFEPAIQHFVLGPDSALARPELALRVERGVRSYFVGIEGRVYRNNSQATAYDHLGGAGSSLRAYGAGAVGKLKAEVFASLGRESIGDILYTDGVLPVANSAAGGGVGATLPLGKGWDVRAGVSLLHKAYDSAPEPGFDARADDVLTLTMRVGRSLGNGMSAYLAPVYVSNRSNMDSNSLIADRNYSQFSGYLGVLWEVLP